MSGEYSDRWITCTDQAIEVRGYYCVDGLHPRARRPGRVRRRQLPRAGDVTP